MYASQHSAGRPAPHPAPAPAPERPGVARVPACSAARRAVAGAVVRRAVDRLPLRVALGPDEVRGLGGPLLDVRDPEAFLSRIAVDGLIGFGESYTAGEWDADDLVGVLTVFAAHAAELVPRPLQRLRGLWAARQPAAQRGTPDGARSNIRRHYDLSNELFALFLDETLTYSSALFEQLPGSRQELAPAQHRKIDRLLDLCHTGPGTRLLEIGTGWGELALRAAARGAVVHSVTLSAEQLALARRRVREAGVQDRVTLELRDYRSLSGQYDAIVSVEMIEAVGAEFWPAYFRSLEELLRPGGRAALQSITMPHERMRASAATHTWIQKYIFPGGLIPSVRAVEETTAAHTGLRLETSAALGPHYAQTLKLWRERFTDHAAEVEALGFDAVFRRMWTFYLAYSEAGFRARYLDLHHFLLTKGDGS